MQRTENLPDLVPEPSKKNRRRLWFFFLATLAFLYALVLINIVYSAKQEATRAKNAFFQTSPDLIAIFTGHHGRIPFGLKLAENFDRVPIFITGVYSKNNVETLTKTVEDNLSIDPSQITIDYFAKNTIGNVIETLRYLENSQQEQKILIVSHDYHINRIKMIFSHLNLNSKNQFYFQATNTDYSKFKNLKILFLESIKTIRTWSLLVLWPESL